MKLKIDREADALYLALDDSRIIESEGVSPGIVVDLNEQNQMVLLNESETSHFQDTPFREIVTKRPR